MSEGLKVRTALKRGLIGVAVGCGLVAVAYGAWIGLFVIAMNSNPSTGRVLGEQVSPDGRKKAALFDSGGDATTPLYMRVLLTDAGSEFDGRRDAVAEFHGWVSRVEWSGGELRVFYGKAEPVRRPDHWSDTPITYWRAD